MRFAPVLDGVAARLAGRPVAEARSDPLGWAYAIRDAVALAEPDVLVSHWDTSLEADALRAAAGGDGDLVERLMDAPALAEAEPMRETVELVRTLAALFPSRVVAATVTGPLTVARELGAADSSADARELEDVCADALAAAAGAYLDAGAAAVLVLEPASGGRARDELAAVHAPLVRKLGHHGAEAVLVPGDGLDEAVDGYTAVAARYRGDGRPPAAWLVDPGLWTLAPAEFSQRLAGLLARGREAGGLLLTDGPIPAGIPLENLQLARTAV